MVVAAIVGGSAISGIAGAVGSMSAANAQKSAALRAIATQKQMFEEGRAGVQPYSDFGASLIPQYEGLLGVGPKGNAGMISTLESMPGYQFTLGQGLRSVQNGYAARGLGTSGAALKGAANYATGLAQSGWGQYANALLGGIGTGAGAAESVLSGAIGAGQGIGQTQVGYGNAAAGGIMGVANSLGGIGNSIGSAYLLNSLINGGGAAGAAYTGGFVPITPSVTGSY